MPELLYLILQSLEFSSELDLVNLALGVEVSVVLVDDRDVGLWHHPAQSCCRCAAQQSSSQCLRASRPQALLEASVHGRRVASRREVTLECGLPVRVEVEEA